MSTVGDAPGTDVPETVTIRELQEVIRIFQRSPWKAMTLEVRGLRIAIGKDGPPAGMAAQALPAAPAAPAVAPAPTPAAAPHPVAPAAPPAAPAVPTSSGTAVDTTGCVAVRSPAVGAFWIAPSPGQPPFVRVGDTVAADEQMAIVEVMKLMNPVIAPTAGEVVQICADNAAMVEYEQILFWIRPHDG